MAPATPPLPWTASTPTAPTGARVPSGSVLTVPARNLESSFARVLRRSVTIPAYALAWLGGIALAPLGLPLLALGDRLGGGQTARARLFLFAVVFLSYELAGLAAAGLLWVATLVWPRFAGARAAAAHTRLQAWWATALYRAAARIFRLTLEVEGADALNPGPLLVLMRHASLADTLLPAVLLSSRGIRLRYVLKRELLWDPCLDVVGQRLPNAFIRRASGESALELGAIAELGRGLALDEGVLIYPEGTRFTPDKRTRALARMAASGRPELLALARGLKAVLPPRTSGVLALLDAAAVADVLIVAHRGLEGLASIADLARIGARGRSIHVQLWRVPRAEIPTGRDARTRWLYDEWARVDAFVGAPAS